MAHSKAAEIRRLNDCFRKNPVLLGKVMLTANVNAHGWAFTQKCLQSVKSYDAFTNDNDPHHEHDFGAFEVDGVELFFKIDYYDYNMIGGSDDPANPACTVRVLTIMERTEY